MLANAALATARCIQAYTFDYAQLRRGHLAEHHQHDVDVSDRQSGSRSELAPFHDGLEQLVFVVQQA